MIELARPAALVALLALPLIVLLFSLRPTRRTVVLASSALWEEVLRERRRGLGLEKLLRNLSLLLLLLFAGLAALGLGDPQWLTPTVDRGDVVVILDTSASMQAVDGGGERFERARAEVRRVIDTLAAGNRLLLMTSARRPLLRTAFEADRERLLAALDGVAVTDEAGFLRPALDVALSLLRHRERARIVVVTDGAFDERFEVGAVEVEVIQVGAAADNLAITRFDVRPEPGAADRWQALVTLASHARDRREVPVVVTLEGAPLVEQVVTLAPGETRTLVWPFRGRASGRVEAIIAVDDALAADDRAYAVLGDDERLGVLLLGPSDPYLESVLAALPNVGVARAASVPAGYAAEEFARHDLVVVNGVALPELPAGAWLLVDTVPPGLPFTDAGPVEAPRVTGRGSSALVDGLDLAGLRVDAARRVTLAADAERVQPLVWSEQGPLALAGIDAGRRFVWLGFSPRRSNLPLQTAFPLFMARAVDWLRPRATRASPTHVAAGEPHAVPVPAGVREVIVRRPGDEAEVLATAEGLLTYERTSRAGFYRVEWEEGFGTVRRWFAVGGGDAGEAGEADLSPRAPPPERSAATAARGERPAALPLWPWLASLALLVLLAEWWLLGGRRHA